MATQQVQRYGDWEEHSSGQDASERLATGLGWFSIGLGLAEILAPSQVAQLIGMKDDDQNRSLLQFYGVREIAAGIGILSQPRPAGWLWARVAGDLLDLGTLGTAMNAYGTDKTKLTAATAAVLGVTALDIICAQQLSGASDGAAQDGNIRMSKSVIVNRSIEEVYQFWRDFQNLPRFMYYLESVEVLDDNRSHWKAKGPAGTTFEWDAEITDERRNESISWRSLEGADVENSGTVRFERAPGGRGTLVRVELEYAPPAGAVGAAIAKLFGKEPGQEIGEDLRRFKQIIETGDVTKSDASIHESMHPAQPSARSEQPDLVLR